MGLQATIREKISNNVSRNGNYKVQFGKLVSVEETIVPGQLYDFAAAQVKLKGKSFTRDFPLMENAAGAMLTDDIANLFDSNMDALWVHARIMHDFKASPVPPKKQVKVALKEYHFLAIERYGNDLEAYPFICTDYNGRSALMFSPYGPSQAIQRKISSDFWHVLLDNPSNMFDFDSQAELEGVTVHFGRRSNQFYYEDI